MYSFRHPATQWLQHLPSHLTINSAFCYTAHVSFLRFSEHTVIIPVRALPADR